MGTKRYHGSCHCKAVTFEVELDLTTGTGRCNCTFCAKVRNWSIGVEPAAFTLLTGADELRHYQFRDGSLNHHQFCQHCGVRVLTRGYVKEIGGDYVSVVVSTLDDAAPRELIEAPVRYMDGLHDNWFSTPVETRHL
ncbi:MAG: aldehyde-activating protein [Myxococcaceae bacterium]|nr:aldehyde-activating protein [Myxococcaceae bacterium]